MLAAAGATGIRVSKDERERCCFGQAGRRRSPRRTDLRGLLLHRRYDSSAGRWRRCCGRPNPGRRQYQLRCANVFHAATATSTRSSCTTPISPRKANVPKRSARAILELASRWAGDSPASTRRCREAAADVREIPTGGAGFFLAARRRRSAIAAQSRQGRSHAVAVGAEFGKMHVHHGNLAHPDCLVSAEDCHEHACRNRAALTRTMSPTS